MTHAARAAPRIIRKVTARSSRSWDARDGILAPGEIRRAARDRPGAVVGPADVVLYLLPRRREPELQEQGAEYEVVAEGPGRRE